MILDLIYDQLIGMGCVCMFIFFWGGNLGVGLLYCLCDVVEYGWFCLLEIDEYSYVGMVVVFIVGVL